MVIDGCENRLANSVENCLWSLMSRLQWNWKAISYEHASSDDVFSFFLKWKKNNILFLNKIWKCNIMGMGVNITVFVESHLTFSINIQLLCFSVVQRFSSLTIVTLRWFKFKKKKCSLVRPSKDYRVAVTVTCKVRVKVKGKDYD